MQEIVRSKSKDVEFIRTSYLRSGEHFDETLNFLLSLKIIKKRSNKIIIKGFNKSDFGSASKFRDLLIQEMMKKMK